MAAAAAVSCAKRNLRAELKQRLRAISAEERLRQSRLLTQKVIAHSQYQKCKRISIFLSMPDEIETEEIIKDIFQRGKTCFIPRYQSQSNHMDMVKLASPEEISSLPRTSWNIHQPGEDEDREEALSTGGLDLIFMPGLAFDKQGNRLGRGRGYYDAYLARCVQTQRSKPYTVALAFSQQICPQVPTDESDVKFKLNIYEKLCSDSVWKEGEVVGRRHGVTKSCHGPGQSRAEIMGGSVSVAPLRVHRPFPCCLLHSPRLIGKSSATAVPSPGPTTAPAPRTRNLPDVWRVSNHWDRPSCHHESPSPRRLVSRTLSSRPPAELPTSWASVRIKGR